MGQVDLFENYLYTIGPCAKKNLFSKNFTKNVNINVQYTILITPETVWRAIKNKSIK